MDNSDERQEELASLGAIFPELKLEGTDVFAARLDLAIAPLKPLVVRFVPCKTQSGTKTSSYSQALADGAAHIERDVFLSHLPPLRLHILLPAAYPASVPPSIKLSTYYDWLPSSKLRELEEECKVLWLEYGQCQILFAFIDLLQQAAEKGFDLDRCTDGCLVLPTDMESKLVSFDSETKKTIFNTGTYDCGICLEPKKGSACYKLERCGDVFCKQCLRDFYNNAITEGDVTGVKCLAPECGEVYSAGKRTRKRRRTLHPRELLAIGIEDKIVRRYVEMKRKKRLEADKNTVYCPRTWCQGPAKCAKYPPIPKDLHAYVLEESSSDGEETAASVQVPRRDTNHSKNKMPKIEPGDRLAVCEKCQLAFCRVCYMGWHGDFTRCYPRDPTQLSAEEKASYDYIRCHTSPCPTCSSPTQKTMGCNHMKCFQCSTHFCYLCGAWLDGENPYMHFNKPGTECYQRLWELEEGDEGQAPDDGRGFRGGRMWEQLALDAAREADAEEERRALEAAVPAAIGPHNDDALEIQVNVRPPSVNQQDRIEVRLGALEIDQENDQVIDGQAAQGERRRNPYPRAPAPGPARAVRNHERAAVRRGRGPLGQARVPVNVEERQQAELQRFLELAQRDEEDDWDSDELGDDDEIYIIR